MLKDICSNPFGIWLLSFKSAFRALEQSQTLRVLKDLYVSSLYGSTFFQVTFRALKYNQNADRFSTQLALRALEDFRLNT